MTEYTLTNEGAAELLRDPGYIADIGQVSPELRRALDKLVKQGQLVRYRGYWNTGSPLFGIGPLKTCWRLAP